MHRFFFLDLGLAWDKIWHFKEEYRLLYVNIAQMRLYLGYISDL